MPTTLSSLVFAMQYDWGISREAITPAPARDGQRPLGLPEVIASDREELLSNAVGWYGAPECLAKLGGDVASLVADGSRWAGAGIDGGSRGAGHGLTVTQSMSRRSAYSESTRSFSIRMARTIDDSSAWPMCGK